MTSKADSGENEAQADAVAAPKFDPPPVDTTVLLEFLFRLGQAYLACGEQTAKVELLLRRTATAYGMRKARVVAFPTAVFISLHDGSGERVTLAECESQALRLDQMADFYALGDAAQTGRMDLREGLERLAAIRRQKPRFGKVGFVFGHTILTIGLTLVLMPTIAQPCRGGGAWAHRGFDQTVQPGRFRHVGAAACDRGDDRFGAGISSNPLRTGGGSGARAGAAARHVSTRSHADAGDGGTCLRRHGERIKPADHRLHPAGAAGVRSRHRRGDRRLPAGVSAALGLPIHPVAIRGVGGCVGVRARGLSAFFRAARTRCSG